MFYNIREKYVYALILMILSRLFVMKYMGLQMVSIISELLRLFPYSFLIFKYKICLPIKNIIPAYIEFILIYFVHVSKNIAVLYELMYFFDNLGKVLNI